MPGLNGGLAGRDARAAYNRAFREFSEKVRTLQRLTANPAADRSEIEAAVLAVERAHQAYSQTRDALAELLLGLPAGSGLPPGLPQTRVHTAEIAELLWESAGRPEGTAETDWLRAEEIIRLAREEVLQP